MKKTIIIAIVVLAITAVATYIFELEAEKSKVPATVNTYKIESSLCSLTFGAMSIITTTYIKEKRRARKWKK